MHKTVPAATKSSDGTDQIPNESSKPSQQDFLEPSKFRFVGAGSAIAFPLTLSKEFGASELPRLHSYAWNTGTRPEAFPHITSRIPRLIGWEQLQALTSVYFSIVHPAFGVICKSDFTQKCADHWIGQTQSLSFDAVVGAVCALGSLFAGDSKSEVESELVQQTKSILDSVSVIHGASEDLAAAWILRSLYLRSTTRPHASWMSTCTTMHIAEAVGLHREINTITSATPNSPSQIPDQRYLETRRKIFWLAWSLNRIFSFEYGRTAVELNGITCEEPLEAHNEYTVNVVRLAKLICPGNGTSRDALARSLLAVGQTAGQPLLLDLLEANASFCLFRRLRLYEPGPTKGEIEKTIAMGRKAIYAARSLALLDHIWWDVLAVPFHYICVLLAIGSLESLSFLSEARVALKDVVAHLQTYMGKEAEQTANMLINMCLEKKRKEMKFLAAEHEETGGGNIFDLHQEMDLNFQSEVEVPIWLRDLQADWNLLSEPFAMASTLNRASEI